MCKFLKTQKQNRKQPRRINRSILKILNVCMCLGSLASISMFVFFAIQHTSRTLELTTLKQSIERQLAQNNSLSVRIANTQALSFQPEHLNELGLVDVDALEYARTQQSAVALR